MTESQTRFRVGCAGVPAGLRRSSYFERLNFLECTEMFDSTPRAKAVRQWRESAPKAGAFGMVASHRITHLPAASDDTLTPEQKAELGRFRRTESMRAEIARLAEQTAILNAETVLFRSPPELSPSGSNRDKLSRFFDEIATAEVFGDAVRVWEPSGLWETRTAAALADKMGVVVSVDPLAANPHAGAEPKPVEFVGRDLGYFRIRGIGRKGPLSDYDIDELAETVTDFERCFIVFANRAWMNKSAKQLKKLLRTFAK